MRRTRRWHRDSGVVSRRRPLWQTILLKAAYWLAVLVLSIALLVLLIRLIESRDKSSVGVVAPAALRGPYGRSSTCFAKTTIRCDAL